MDARKLLRLIESGRVGSASTKYSAHSEDGVVGLVRRLAIAVDPRFAGAPRRLLAPLLRFLLQRRLIDLHVGAGFQAPQISGHQLATDLAADA
jgi:hypothetical protein